MTPCILACDHEPHVTRIMSQKLERAGLDVRTTSDGPTAWNRVRELSPELLIIDADLPDMDGLEVISRLRAEPEYFDLPVILLTTHDVDAGLLLDLRIDYVLQKPFSPRELTALAANIVHPHAVPA
ncbi:MAG TPA: response regulator [Planctomycetaceae bacterium]|nr:response regulator [Planctomycetaceae bacterium]